MAYSERPTSITSPVGAALSGVHGTVGEGVGEGVGVSWGVGVWVGDGVTFGARVATGVTGVSVEPPRVSSIGVQLAGAASASEPSGA